MNASLFPTWCAIRNVLLAVAPIILVAQQQLAPRERLERARQVLSERNRHLADYMCIQTVNRRYFAPRHARVPAPPCDRRHFPDSEELMLQSTERLRLDLKVSDGNEIGSWGSSKFTSRSIFELIGGGAYGTGTIGALYSDVLANVGASYRYVGESIAVDDTLWEYTYQIPREFSHYQVKVRSEWTVVAIHGAFWLDSNTLGLKRLLVEAQDLPPETGECAATTTIDYQKVHVGTGDFLLPQQSLIRMLMLDGSVIEVVGAYSGWREYHGEATVQLRSAHTRHRDRNA